LKTSIIVNDNPIPLNRFTQNYIGNILRAILLSLGHVSKDIIIAIDQKGLCIYTEKGDVPILKDFARMLVESTIKGMLSPLKGVFWLERIRIVSRDLTETPAKVYEGEVSGK